MIARNRIKNFWAILVGAILTWSCGLSTELERDAVDVPLAEILSVRRVGCCALSADGVSTDTIIAQIPRESKERSVSFSTTRGVFLGDEKKEASATAFPVGGEWLEARVVLRADTLPGQAVITSTIAGFRDTVSVAMTN